MVTVLLDPTLSRPLYEQLYEYIRSCILEGSLAAGEKLPSKRQLAAHLKISRNTVEMAYAQLAAEGYISSRERKGYYVERVEQRTVQPSALPRREERLEEARPAEFDLRTNRVDPSLFPFSTWSRLSREVLSSSQSSLLSSGHPQGIPPLRREIARYLREYRGVLADEEQIVVGAGSEYLLLLLVQLLGNPLFGVENPGYEKLRRVLAVSGQATALPLDADGLRVDILEKTRVYAVHITPSHQFPLGAVMPVSRRIQLLNWASRGERYILEDDYDSEFRFTGRPIPAMQGMDKEGRVIYLNTFAKSLTPSLRISYLVLPPKLLEQFQQTLGFYSCTVPRFEQETLYRFLAGGHYERHLSRMRKRYRARRDHFIACLQAEGITRYTSLSGQEAGLHLILRVTDGRKEGELLQSARAKGVWLAGLSDYCADGVTEPATLLAGYAGLSSEEMSEAVRRLAQAWNH